MAVFKPNVPVVQPEPLVKVEVSPAAPLPLGANRFQLVVVDDQGNESAPFFLDVVVQAVNEPTAVLDMVDENGARIEPTVVAGKTFILSGKRSTDVPPGKVVEYRFTLLDRVA
jgi:hypothetical protein